MTADDYDDVDGDDDDKDINNDDDNDENMNMVKIHHIYDTPPCVITLCIDIITIILYFIIIIK